MNYSEQIDYLIPGSERDRVRMTDILERAGFSRHGISADEFRYADSVLEGLIQSKQ